MLKWHKNYYIGPGIKNISRIRRRLEHGKPVPGIYLITLSENPCNLLEILPALINICMITNARITIAYVIRLFFVVLFIFFNIPSTYTFS